MKLSILICVYNTPPEYLNSALRSVTESTLKSFEGEWEICLVDDGSTVSYDALTLEYGVRYLKT